MNNVVCGPTPPCLLLAPTSFLLFACLPALGIAFRVSAPPPPFPRLGEWPIHSRAAQRTPVPLMACLAHFPTTPPPPAECVDSPTYLQLRQRADNFLPYDLGNNPLPTTDDWWAQGPSLARRPLRTRPSRPCLCPLPFHACLHASWPLLPAQALLSSSTSLSAGQPLLGHCLHPRQGGARLPD